MNRPVDALTETQLIKIVGHADFEMIRDTYYHLDGEGESGRNMRKTPLFGNIVDTPSTNPDPATVSEEQIIFGLSLRGA